MRRPPTDTERLAALADCTVAIGRPGQPRTGFDAVEAALGRLIGHKLFTLMLLDSAKGEAERVYSNRPEAYPVRGRKPLGAMTDWGRHVIEGRRPYLGRTAADIRWAFFDHELIASLGCASVVNLLVTFNGALLGTVNMLHEEDYYRESDQDLGAPFAQVLVPLYLQLISGELSTDPPPREGGGKS